MLPLPAEIDQHDELLDILTRAAVPTLREALGIGPESAAEMMVVAGDNPGRIRSEAAFAKLCGACPIPASSGLTNRHRLFRGLPGRPPPRQRDALPDRDRPHALAPADHRLRPATHRRGLVEERHHPLPEALRRPGGLPRTHRRPQVRPAPRPPDVRLRAHALDVLVSRTGGRCRSRPETGCCNCRSVADRTDVEPREGRPRILRQPSSRTRRVRSSAGPLVNHVSW